MKLFRLLSAAAVLVLLTACGSSENGSVSAAPAAGVNASVAETMVSEVSVAPEASQASEVSMAPEASQVPEAPVAAVSSGEITEDDAVSIALADAGVQAEDVTRLRVRLELDDGVWEYEVDFYVGNQEYDYDIAQTDGSIRSKDRDIENDHFENGMAQETTDGITLEDAKAIVLDKVPGASADQLRIHLDRDDGREIYEGSLIHQSMEYDFEIDVQTGTILEWEKESVFD